MNKISKQQIYDILERISDGIVALDKNWCYIYVNRLGAEILGRKPEDLIGKHIWTEFPEGIGQPFYNAYCRDMDEQTSIKIEEYYPPWDRWFENRIYPSADGITILFQEITNKKKVEERYLIEKVFSNSLINSLPGTFYMFNEEGKFQRWNYNFEIVSGYSSEEIAGMKPTDFFAGEEKELIANRIREVFITGKASVEARLISRDGKATPFLFTGQLFQIENQKFLIGMGIDISERKKAEDAVRASSQELLSINRVISTCSSTLDLSTVLQKALDEALAITGLEGGTFCLLESDDTLSLGAQRDASEAMISDLMSHRIRVGDCLCGTCAHDKRPLILWNRDEVRSFSTLEATIGDDIRFHAAFPVMRENSCLGVLCVFTRTDMKPSERSLSLLETITAQISLSIENARLYRNVLNHSEKLEEKVAERTAELERANIRLKELDRLKSIFIATMSHELRTPLNSIIGFTGIILQGLTGDITAEQSKQLSIVKKSANHLLDLINDVIDISKIETDSVELYPVDIDISRLLNEVIVSFSNTVEEKRLSLVIKIPEKLIIRSDEKRVRQVLNNLLSNAIKFTYEGEIEIQVVEEDRNVRIYVRDTGIGIKPEDMGKLFMAFSKIRYEHMPVIEGTGLGLYLSYKIAHLLGGELSAESEFGHGSTFIFFLPKGAAEI